MHGSQVATRKEEIFSEETSETLKLDAKKDLALAVAVAPAPMSDDPSQSAAQAAGRQDRAAQEKWRDKIQAGSLTGLAERNTKWDVEYEGKDAIGTLVRPFEPGWGDARRVPEKMLGETAWQSVQRSMGREIPHSGMGDGKKVFTTDENPALLRKMLREEQEKDAPPPLPRLAHNIRNQAEQQRRLQDQWAVGLTGGTYGMHTRHVTTAPPAFESVEAARLSPPRAVRGTSPEKGPPRSPQRKALGDKSSVMVDGSFNPETTYSRESPFAKQRRQLTNGAPPSPMSAMSLVPRSRDKPHRNEGAHAMLDRMGPNIASGPIPRDGFTSDMYAHTHPLSSPASALPSPACLGATCYAISRACVGATWQV